MKFVDRDLKCVDCGQMFLFSADEQQFFREKGFVNDPKRCKPCKNRRHRGGTVQARIICAQCRKEATVPFKPKGNKPVYCLSCFHRQSKPNSTTTPAVDA